MQHDSEQLNEMAVTSVLVGTIQHIRGWPQRRLSANPTPRVAFGAVSTHSTRRLSLRLAYPKDVAMWIHRLGILCALAAAPALSHHSVAANFDASTTLEAQGEITRIAWRNPHILFTLATADGEELDLESHSLSIMRRLGAVDPFIQVGDHVRVAGWPSRRGEGLFVNNMLLPNGEEFVFKFQPTPADLLWSDRMWGTTENWFAETGDTSAEERGIFRAWSTTLVGRTSMIALAQYPLTQAAIAARDAYDPLTDDPLLNCGLKGMPAIMSNPYPMEFHDRGDTIELRLEEYDTLRTIYVNPATAPAPTPSIYGHSTGRWDGETLVVDTAHINWGFFSGGVPLSEQAHLVERFTPTENGGRLEYEVTVTDPETFMEPIVMSRFWVWLPDVRVEPYECIAGTEY